MPPRAQGGISDDARGRQLLPFTHSSGTSCFMCGLTHTTTTRFTTLTTIEADTWTRRLCVNS
jgi:hypothetical protein